MVDQVDHKVQDHFPNKREMLINDHLYLLYVMADIEHHHDQQVQFDHHQLELKNERKIFEIKIYFIPTMLMTMKINN
jgi:hypothetical protein